MHRQSTHNDPQADQTEISSSENHELNDINKYGTVYWEGYTPAEKPAVKNVNVKLHNLEEPLYRHNTKKCKASVTVEHKANAVVLHFPKTDDHRPSKRPSYCRFFKSSSPPLSVHPMETRSKTKKLTMKKIQN